MTSSQTVPALVAAYAEAVRRELGDLPATDVEDLTEGLEADLMEQFADSGAVPALSPVAYAAELRSSAGLPERNAAITDRKGPGVRDSFRKAGSDFLARLRANPASNAVLEFLIKLRPVWWLLRAWAIFQIISVPLFGSRGYVPRGLTPWLFLMALVVLSVRWGSRPAPVKTVPRRFLNAINIVCVAFMVIMAPFIIAHALTPDYNPAPASYNSGYIPPLSVNGASVEHVFAYDKDGNLLRDIRFYDQDGNPVDMPLPDGLTAPQHLPTGAQPGEPFSPATEPGGDPVPSSSATPEPSVTPSVPTGKASPAPTQAPSPSPSPSPSKH
jgi:hypothetical protein